MQDQNRDPLNFLKVVRFLYRWKITFSIAIIGSAVLAYFFASPPITTPLYRSVSVFYPTSEGALSDQVVQPDAVHDEGYLDFGEEKRVEGFLQVLKSESLKSIMLKRFNLFEHYDIPKSADNRYKRYLKTFRSNVNFSKTQFMAVEVEVFDEDPKHAAKMANTLVDLADSLQASMRKERARKAMQVMYDKYQDQRARFAELSDSAAVLAERGLVAFEGQSERLTETLGKAQLNQQRQLVEELQQQLDVVGRLGPVYHGLVEQMTKVNERTAILYEAYQRIRADVESDLSDVYVLDRARPSDDDAKPNKPLIVVIVVIGSFIVTALLARLYERWSTFKAEITG